MSDWHEYDRIQQAARRQAEQCERDLATVNDTFSRWLLSMAARFNRWAEEQARRGKYDDD